MNSEEAGMSVRLSNRHTYKNYHGIYCILFGNLCQWCVCVCVCVLCVCLCECVCVRTIATCMGDVYLQSTRATMVCDNICNVNVSLCSKQMVVSTCIKQLGALERLWNETIRGGTK